jgi:hypothetical protein
MAYHLEGRLLEVCNCRVLCPCWIGEDPDSGTCDTIVAWHFDKGTVEGVDVAGSTIVCVAHVPSNILQGNWRIYINDKASEQQKDARDQMRHCYGHSMEAGQGVWRSAIDRMLPSGR